MAWISNHNAHPGGRIVVLWNPDLVQVNVLFSSAQLLHIELLAYDFSVMVSAIYGFNDPDGRSQLWKYLHAISINMHSAWIALGDFNAIRVHDERHCKMDPSILDMDGFNECIADSNLIEADYKGAWFTWDNHQLGNNLILSKIDRVFFITKD